MHWDKRWRWEAKKPEDSYAFPKWNTNIKLLSQSCICPNDLWRQWNNTSMLAKKHPFTFTKHQNTANLGLQTYEKNQWTLDRTDVDFSSQINFANCKSLRSGRNYNSLIDYLNTFRVVSSIQSRRLKFFLQARWSWRINLHILISQSNTNLDYETLYRDRTIIVSPSVSVWIFKQVPREDNKQGEMLGWLVAAHIIFSILTRVKTIKVTS